MVNISHYMLHLFGFKSPPILVEDVSAPAGYCEVGHISARQLACGRGGLKVVPYETY